MNAFPITPSRFICAYLSGVLASITPFWGIPLLGIAPALKSSSPPHFIVPLPGLRCSSHGRQNVDGSAESVARTALPSVGEGKEDFSL